MIILKDSLFHKQLFEILKFIAKDKPKATKKFEQKLNQQINDLPNNPFKFRQSHYFEDVAYRDMVYQGYTIVYKVETERILILEIFKWQNR